MCQGPLVVTWFRSLQCLAGLCQIPIEFKKPQAHLSPQREAHVDDSCFKHWPMQKINSSSNARTTIPLKICNMKCHATCHQFWPKVFFFEGNQGKHEDVKSHHLLFGAPFGVCGCMPLSWSGVTCCQSLNAPDQQELPGFAKWCKERDVEQIGGCQINFATCRGSIAQCDVYFQENPYFIPLCSGSFFAVLQHKALIVRGCCTLS